MTVTVRTKIKRDKERELCSMVRNMRHPNVTLVTYLRVKYLNALPKFLYRRKISNVILRGVIMYMFFAEKY